MRSRLLAACVTLACAVGMVVGTASAQVDDEGGLQVDPGSPSGREYAVPLDDARRRGSAGPRPKKVTPGVSNSAPAFGEGIESDDTSNGDDGDDSSGSGSRSDASGSGGSGGTTGAGGDRADATKRPVSTPAAADVANASADTGSGQVAAIAGIGGGVLLLGAAAGLVLRRRAG